jgi:hypothetical protein
LDDHRDERRVRPVRQAILGQLAVRSRDRGEQGGVTDDRVYQYVALRYAGDSPSGKTQVWRVETRHGDPLGTVRWFGRWRQYTFQPSPATIYSAGCLTDIADFIQALQAERRNPPSGTTTND